MSDPASNPLQAAFGLFQAGRLAEAESALRRLVDLPGAPAAAWNLLGVVLHERQAHDESLQCMQRAIDAPGAGPEHHNNLAILLHEHGQFAEAESSCRHALSLRPDYADAHYHLGNSLLAMRRSDEAIHAYRRAIAIHPEHMDAYNNLGGALRQQGRLHEAIACCRKVLSLRPEDPKMHSNLGSLLRDLDQFDEAATSYRRALQLSPDYVDAHLNLGGLLQAQKRFAEAADSYQSVLRLRPEHPEALANLGAVLQALGKTQEASACYQRATQARPKDAASLSALGTTLQEQGKLDDAIACYRQALTLDPNHAGAQNNLGLALSEQGHYEESLECYQRAIVAQADFYEAWNNIGNLYLDLNRPDDAMRAYRKATAIRPDYPDGHWNKALLLLLDGQYADGWPEYEWRWQRFKECRRNLRQPRWDGAPFPGKTLLVHAEQGFGDTIQFARLLPLVRARAGEGAKIFVESQPELLALLQTLAGPDQVYPQGHPLPDFHLQIPLMSLAEALEITLETIPSKIPYLTANADKVTAWRTRLEADPITNQKSEIKNPRPLDPSTQRGGRPLRIGLSWAGRPTHKKDRLRSARLADLAPLAAIPNTQFYSLQKWRPAAHGEAPDIFPLLDHTADLMDFSDTAALMANLDLILGVDTAIVHLAGALGRPVFTLLASNPDWRWLRHRATTPWYPTMQLFRQTKPGDWAGVVSQVAPAVAALAERSRT